MKTPNFWKTKNIISTILLPLGWVYGFLTKRRVSKKPQYAAPIPVICIGNITAGGVGKTPVAISIAKMLKNPYFISRGYGAKLKDALVDIKKHNAKDVGDEPMLLAKNFPTIINANRAQSAKKAVLLGAKHLIMDDGLQNPTLKKTLSFAVIDGAYGFGNFRYIPAGPMREKQIRANAVIILGEDKHNLAKTIEKPIFYGKIQAIKPKDTNKKIFAFAGIGRPQKFYDSLTECGFIVAETINFPDHHQYKKQELEQIIKQAKQKEIWTTAKDYIKIPKSMQKKFNVLDITIKWQDEKAIKDFIIKNI